MRVTVIGGSGFIGSHVADVLSDKGHTVKIFDKNKSQWIRKDQELQQGDIFNYNELDRAIKSADIVYNFAALSDLNEALDEPIETVKSNILGTVNALDICRKNKVKRFIHASTIYANSSEGGFYRCSKKAAEDYVDEYNKIYGINYTILRYGSIYGPRSDDTNGVNKIIKNAILTDEINYMGNKNSVREYIHVFDAALASVGVLKNEFKNKCIIITGKKSVKVSKFLKILAKIMQLSGKINFQNRENKGHYVKVPLPYKPKLGSKYLNLTHVGFEKSLLKLAEDIKKDINRDLSKKK